MHHIASCSLLLASNATVASVSTPPTACSCGFCCARGCLQRAHCRPLPHPLPSLTVVRALPAMLPRLELLLLAPPTAASTRRCSYHRCGRRSSCLVHHRRVSLCLPWPSLPRCHLIACRNWYVRTWVRLRCTSLYEVLPAELPKPMLIYINNRL